MTRRQATRVRLLHQRAAFTLVELMVSLALIIFIMSILSAAFGEAAKTVRALKAAGDLAEKLRGVTTMLRNDLAAQHFDIGRLSDGTVWANNRPPREGFFRIHQSRDLYPANPQSPPFPPPPPPPETFGPTIPEFINTVSSLHFSVKLPHTTPAEVFSTELALTHPILTSTSVTARERELRFQPVSGNSVFKSEWAEVAYWLAPSGETTDRETTSPQPLYTLYRRQRLLWPYGGTAADVPGGYDELSTRPGTATPNTLRMNKPSDIALPPFRFGMLDPSPGGNAGRVLADTRFAGLLPVGADGLQRYPAVPSSDVVISDVLSFDVRVLLDNYRLEFVNLYHTEVQNFSHGNTQYSAPGGPRVFDTWAGTTVDGWNYDALSTTDPLRENWEAFGTNASIPLFWPNRYNATPGNPIRIRAIKVTLRLYDAKTGTTRQVSMIQDM